MWSPIAVILLAYGASAAQSAVKDTPAGGYFNTPAAAPPAQTGYGYPAPQPVYYQPVYQPPQYALPNYDVNYCTVHASFPMVDRKHRRHHKRVRRSYGQAQLTYDQPQATYGQAQPAYGQPQVTYGAPYGAGPYARSARFERQSCRHSAIYSQESCNTCCRVASRGSNTNADEIVGALFVFDPEMDTHHDSNEESNEKALQCVCCAPKRV